MRAQLRRIAPLSLIALSLAAPATWLLGAVDARASFIKCRRIHGSITLRPSPAPTCASPVGICATGELTGALAGKSSFLGSSLTPTVDTPSTSAVLLTGDNLITLKRGTLLTKDAVVLRTTGAGEFAEVDTIVGGTGDWAGVTGVYTATGSYDAVSGGQGTYEGEVCFP